MNRVNDRKLRGGVNRVVISLVLLIGVGFSGVYSWRKMSQDERYALYLNFFERTAPTVQFVNPPPGLGAERSDFLLEVNDSQTGIDQVVVRLEQGSESHEVFRKDYDHLQFSDRIPLTIDARKLKLSPGQVRFAISAFDRSFFSNGSRSEVDFKVDFQRPRLVVVSVQHNGVIGGSELVFYQSSDSDLYQSGVEVGSRKFLGVAAKYLDPQFETVKDLYATLIAFPLDFDEETQPVRAFAEDEVRNVTYHPFYFHAQKVRGTVRDRELSERWNVERLKQSLGEIGDSGTLEQLFKKLAIDLRAADDTAISRRFGRPRPERFWTGALPRVPGTFRIDFGDIRRYRLGDTVVASVTSTGVDFALPATASIPAMGDGVVAFAGVFPSYGNTIIVDHGFGLLSLYGSLAEIQRKEGDTVHVGDSLGRAGRSGFAEEDQVHVEFRVQGLPVRPVEWWDKRWVGDHLLDKIEEVKRTVGVAQVTGD